jgi:hypothetical protein
MKLRNYWLDKVREKVLLKVIEWAHRHNRPVQKLTQEEINEAIKAHLREASHAS